MIEKTKSMRNLTSKESEEVFALFTICKLDETYPRSFIYRDHPDWESKDKDADGNPLIGLEVVMASDTSGDEWMSDKAYTVLKPSECINRGFETEGHIIFNKTGKPGFVRVYPSRYYFEILVDASVVCSGDYLCLGEEQKGFLDEYRSMAIIEGDPREKDYYIDLDKIMKAFEEKCKKQNYSKCSSYHLFIEDMDTLYVSSEEINDLIEKMRLKQEEVNTMKFDVVFLRTIQHIIKIDLINSQYSVMPIGCRSRLVLDFQKVSEGVDFCKGLDSTVFFGSNVSPVSPEHGNVPQKLCDYKTMEKNKEKERIERMDSNIQFISKLVDMFGDNPSVSFLYPNYYPLEMRRDDMA